MIIDTNMDELISPKYQMKLTSSVETAIWDEYKSYKDVRLYIEKWHKNNYDPTSFNDNYWENFKIVEKQNHDIDLKLTLHSMKGPDLLKVAIDLGVDTPDFIPSIPTFKNDLKCHHKTAYGTFSQAFRQVETDPSLAIGLANSALESIVKNILKEDCFTNKLSGGETLYKLTLVILKEFKLMDSLYPLEVKTIGSSLLAVSQAIEKLRSEKTNFHGKTTDDHLITDPLYTYFIINTVATVGLFLNSYYKSKFPKPKEISNWNDDLPF